MDRVTSRITLTLDSHGWLVDYVTKPVVVSRKREKVAWQEGQGLLCSRSQGSCEQTDPRAAVKAADPAPHPHYSSLSFICITNLE